MTEITPTTSTMRTEYSHKDPLIDRPQIKKVDKILHRENIQQTTVYTYNKWGQLESTVLYNKPINQIV